MRHTSDDMAIDNVVIAILRQEDQLLLVQQVAPDQSRIYWVLPGGLVEAGELLIDAVVREVAEEAGVEVLKVGRWVCCSQIDRPFHAMQTLVFVFEVTEWQGTPAPQDPDGEVIAAALIPYAEALHRLATNGGWPGIQEPLLAYLQDEQSAGTFWSYHEDAHGQHLVSVIGAKS